MSNLTFFFHKPASLIDKFFFFLADHRSPLILGVYHELLLSIKRFFFLLPLSRNFLHLLGQLSGHKSKYRIVSVERASSIVVFIPRGASAAHKLRAQSFANFTAFQSIVKPLQFTLLLQAVKITAAEVQLNVILIF